MVNPESNPFYGIEKNKERLVYSAIVERYGEISPSDVVLRGRLERYPHVTKYFFDGKELIDIYEPIQDINSSIINTSIKYKKY